MAILPLSLYIHIPWCVRKCPYCDFNSHEIHHSLPETLYVKALMEDLDQHLPYIQNRPLTSIFFGGGTPSLLSGTMIAEILKGVTQRVALLPQIEITLEANPGTVDQTRFADFFQAGVNRLSLGIQSFQNEKLKALGRIHDSENAIRAIDMAKAAGFSNLNLDLMYGLPNQNQAEALLDLKTALAFNLTHLSWYQLTLEPNTLFYHQPPALPADDIIWEMQLAGEALINQYGLRQYEVSAYSLPQKNCLHNRNYWEFGDYLGIGAGAHSKITDGKNGEVVRFFQVKHPRDYLDKSKRHSPPVHTVSEKDLIFEFMLNALRLTEGVSVNLFVERTGIPLQQIAALVRAAVECDFLLDDPSRLCASELGRKFLNDLVMVFLPNTISSATK